MENGDICPNKLVCVVITLVVYGLKQQRIGYLNYLESLLHVAGVDTLGCLYEDTVVVKSVGSGARPCAFQLLVPHFLIL